MNAEPEIITDEETDMFEQVGVAASKVVAKASQSMVARQEQINVPVADAGTLTPMQMAYQLIQGGADLGSVKEMLALSKELAADQARRAFDAAVAAAKAEIPIVSKNAKGHNDKRYADFSAYAAALKDVLATHGLSYRFKTEQTDKITVTCVLSHKDGHSEENSLSGPADGSGSKNAIQAIGSTLTYLQRYTLIQALGLAASNDDDGKAAGQTVDTGPINEEQAKTIRDLIDEGGVDIAIFCEKWKVDAVPELPISQFEPARKSLVSWIASQKAQRRAS